MYMTFLYAQFVKNKAKWKTEKHACWSWTHEKPVYGLKRSFFVSFSPADFLLFFLLREGFFPKHVSRGNGQKGLVRSRAVDQGSAVMLYSRTAMGGYGPAGSFQIWYDATTPHLQEDHGGWSFRCVLAGMLCWRQMSKFQLRLYARHLWAEQPNQGGQTRGLCSEPWEVLL